MMKKDLSRRAFCAASLAGTLGTGVVSAEKSLRNDGVTKRPNVIWFMVDQHRAQALGCMGDPNVKTPNLDRLVGSGMTAVAGSPLCTPFRGSMLTSRYPHACCPGHDIAMPDGLPTVATAFRDAGYRTAYFGKWHVDGRENRSEGERSGKQFVRPERRGDFETWLGYENNNAQWDCWVHGHDARGDAIDLYQLPKYETDALTDLAIDYVRDRGREHREDDANPFFLVVSVQPPHGPYRAPEEWMARHTPESIQLRANVPPVVRVIDEARRDLAGYYAMIENIDWNVGRVLETLENTGLHENTYFMFFSDHGDMHGSHGRILKCVPWEESIRVPFVVSRGGRPCQHASETLHTTINHVDLAPTTLGLCGVAKPDWMDGHDSSNLVLRGDDTGLPDSAYLQLVDPGFLYGFAPDRERPWRGVVTRDGWKYAVLEGQPWLLYNLNEDPYELDNRAMDRRFRKDRKRLQECLAQWMDETGDAFELPNLP